MVWVYFSFTGSGKRLIIEGKMNGTIYHEILDDNYLLKANDRQENGCSAGQQSQAYGQGNIVVVSATESKGNVVVKSVARRKIKQII